jgi:hypothetical protein
MNDDELKRILQGALCGRRLSDASRERMLRALQVRKRSSWIAAVSAAAAAALVWTAVRGAGSAASPELIRRAVEQHREARTFGHTGVSTHDVAEMVGEACGREMELPGLRDGGFVQLQAHGCAKMGGVHVVYANSWLKVSCFVLPKESARLDGVRRVEESGIGMYRAEHAGHSVTAIPEGDLLKVWVAELKPEQLTAIAVDAELKRFQLKTTVFTVRDAAISGPLRAALRNTPGVEDVRVEEARREAYIRYDRRRVSPDDLAAMMVLDGFPAAPREWGGR